MHNFYNQFLFHIFLSALHVSSESLRPSSGAQRNVLYYTVQSVQSRCKNFLSQIQIIRLILILLYYVYFKLDKEKNQRIRKKQEHSV